MTLDAAAPQLAIRALDVRGEQDPLPARLYTGGEPGP
jgi:hypothetical protein